MFHVRSIFPDRREVEETSVDLTPTDPRSEAVCHLIQQYLDSHPAAFRDRLTFLKIADLELDWSAVDGGVALASFYHSGAPAAVSVLLSGTDPTADSTMLDVFRETVPGAHLDSEFDRLADMETRPLVVQIVFCGDPQFARTVQLVSASLAAVYFRSVIPSRGDDGSRA